MYTKGDDNVNSAPSCSARNLWSNSVLSGSTVRTVHIIHSALCRDGSISFSPFHNALFSLILAPLDVLALVSCYWYFCDLRRRTSCGRLNDTLVTFFCIFSTAPSRLSALACWFSKKNQHHLNDFLFFLRSFNYAQIEIRNIERKGRNMWK